MAAVKTLRPPPIYLMYGPLESNITEQVNKSIMDVKDSIIDALKDENKMLQVKVDILQKKIAEDEKSFNRLGQYNRRNNLEIQDISSVVGDEVLEEKVFEIFECLNIPLAKSDIEDFHRLDKSIPKNTIVRFVNRKNCYAGLSEKMDLRHIDKVKLGFPEANSFFSENLTPYNQKLPWKRWELKRAGKIHSTWSSKGVIKLRRTMN